MAALSTAVTSTDVEELIETELISDYFAGFEYPMPVAFQVAAIKGGQGNIAVRFPRLNEVDLSGIGTNHTETNNATDIEVDTTDSSITPAMQICRIPFSDESVVMAKHGQVPVKILEDAVVAMGNRMDVAILANSTSAALQTGSVASACTLQNLRSALVYFSTQDIPSTTPNIVLSQSAAGSLWESMGSTGATFALAPDDMKRFSINGGYQGMLLGGRVFKSSNVATETTGYSNFIVPSENSSLGVVLVEKPNVRMTRGDDAESRATTYFVIRAWWGSGIINPRQFVEYLSS